MQSSVRTALVRYGSAALAVVLAAAIRLALDSTLSAYFPLLTFLIALVFAAWYGGVGPCLLALALSLAAIPIVSRDSPGPFLDWEFGAWVELGRYILAGLAIAFLGWWMRAAQRRAEVGELRAKQAVEAGREQRERLRITLASVGDAVIVTDAEGRVSSLNPVAESLTGWTTEEADGRPLKEVFRTLVEETQKTAEMPVAEVVHGGAAIRQVSPTDLISRDGTTRAIEHTTAPLLDRAGRIEGVVLVFRDITQRRRTEQTLRESEQRFRQLTEAMPQIVWMAGPDGSVNYFNRRWYEYTGMTDQESLTGDIWKEVVHPDDVARLFALRNRAVGGGDLFESEYRLRDREGCYRWHLVRSVPVRDESGQVVQRLGTATDIDDRIQAEEALRASEGRFRLLTEAMPQLVWSSRPDGHIDYCNPRWLDFTGFSQEQVQGNGWAKALHPDDAAETMRAWRQAMERGAPFQVEQRLRSKEGPYRWFLTRALPLRDEGGEILKWYGTCTDIDDQKRDREALLVSEEQYRAIYSQAAVGIAEVDLTGHFTRANDRYCQIVGRPWDELRHLRFQDITHPDDLPMNLELFNKVTTGASKYTIEKRYVRSDRRVVWARTAVSLIRDSAGRPVRAAAIIEDITERKRLEGELQRRMEELAEADRRKDEFLATLAHELRNPLAPIRNALLLMKDSGDPNDLESERARAERQVVHLARLVDDLMDVSRITNGKIELRKEPLELASLVGRAVESVRPSIEERGHELSISLPTEPIRLEADPTRLEQVLWNLLSNAAKYTESGGRIAISAEREGEEVTIRVRDSGTGIEAGILPRIFEMFVQAEHRSGRAQGGLGIGLSLVKTLVEMHGGGISAHSEGPGAGSEFIVRLPILPITDINGVHATRGPSPEAASTPPPRRRILVVDDNVDAARSLAKLLRRLFDQEVEVAHDGPSALEAARRLRPEIVLLDIGMPGMDGYELAERLRSCPEFEKTMLVALTGWGQEADRQKSKAAGIDIHLVKPIAPEALRELLAQ
ncbi:MAG TPA: PAS domain S-box protein [Isosphaeraceae bacterium]|jgi:PAS domain S-box-containing protein|nr:PAS domain S-box protein [Isosphaeraceae bacterium]